MRRWILPVVVALAASTVAAPAYAADTPGTESPVPGVTDSARLSSPVLVAGSITASDGKVAAGVPVAIRVWPDSETLGKLPIGATVPTQIVGVATTDAKGGYQLRLDPAKPIAKFADPNGIVSFDVVAGSGATSTSFSLTREASELSTSASAARIAAPEVSDVDLKLPAVAATAAKGDSASVAAVACSLQKLATYGAQWTVVGETYTSTNSTATFTYTKGASSTLGVGVSSGGVFTAGGTSSVTSTATLTFPTTPKTSARKWRTQFRYDKFTDLCGHIYARPTAFLGGTGQLIPNTIPASYCTPMLANSSHTQSTDNATTLTTGVDTSTDIGIDLSARTGYTTSAKLKYTFSASGQLCGTIGYPGHNPGRLAAKS